ncbi:MAG: iron(III) transport system substrate-binding protein [Miltoncostaeaceae bacterium]|nr:iron(III) transport system substrate-binding protein [Miltoncostaeaceae bacterium]
MRTGALPGLLFALVLAGSGFVLAGCGDREALTIYSGRTENLVGPLLEQFAEETGTAIDVRYGDTADLALLLAEEGDRTPADVFFGQSPGAAAFLDKEGLLRSLPQEVLDLVDERFHAADGHWVGVSGRQRVLVYNKDMVAEADLPDSVFDLTAPEYRGRVGLAPSNGSFQDFITAMRSLEGEGRAEAWLRAMADNDSPTYANNNAIVEAVGRGEVPMGLVNHYYNERFLAEDPSLPSRNHTLADGDVGTLVIPSNVSVLEGTDQPEAAEEFVRFLLTEEAQRYFAEETFEYPLVDGVPPVGDLPPLDALRPPDYLPEQLADLEGTARLIAESGLD